MPAIAAKNTGGYALPVTEISLGVQNVPGSHDDKLRNAPVAFDRLPGSAADATVIERLHVLADVGPDMLDAIRKLLALMAIQADEIRKGNDYAVCETLRPLETALSSAGALTQTLENLLNRRDTKRQSCIIRPLEHLAGRRPLFDRALGKVPLRYDLSLPSRRYFKASPVEFEAVILNLVINARDALLAARTNAPLVRIHARAVSMKGRGGTTSRALRIAVSDNGPGMDPKTAANATQPYFTTKGALGTGMGLHQAQRFCEMLGGRLIIKTKKECGTTIVLLIPYVPTAKSAPVERSEDKLAVEVRQSRLNKPLLSGRAAWRSVGTAPVP